MNKVKLLHSYGKQDIEEYEYEMDLRNIPNNTILVKTKMVGVCRSDIGAYMGVEAPMPFGKFGHEGLGVVHKIGKGIEDVREGDYVATFSDPAYADFYFAKKKEYVRVPSLHPKYILQPVACAVNIYMETLRAIDNTLSKEEPILIVGAGFLSCVIAALTDFGSKCNIDIVGKSNSKFFESKPYINRFDSVLQVRRKYHTVIDLSSKPENFNLIIDNIIEDGGVLCYAATPSSPITTNFFNACWKAIKIILPSPRSSGFYDAMLIVKEEIEDGMLDVSKLWTKGYDRKTGYKQAFKDGTDRVPDYIRGYIEWD